MNLRSALRISFRIHSVLKLGLHPYFGHIQVYSELVLQTQKTENFLLLTDFIEDLWWPEVELNHRHTDFQSVALPTELSGLGGDRKVFFKHMNILDF